MTNPVILARHLRPSRSDPTVLWDWRVRAAGADVDAACGVTGRFDRALTGARRALHALAADAVAEVWSASLDLDTGHAYRRDTLVCRAVLSGDGAIVWHRS